MVNLNDDHRLAKLIKSLRDKDKIKILLYAWATYAALRQPKE